jgi:arylsulfatase
VQIFETNGNKAIYKDGWWAGNLLRNSWDRIGAPGFEPDKLLAGTTHPWELYNLDNDYSQSNNLAAKNPQKLAEMKALFDAEAQRTHVYPMLPLRQLIDRPEDKRTKFVFRSGVDRLGGTMNVRTGAGTGYTITAEIENPDGKAQGVLLADGGRYGGFTLYVQDGRVHFEINSWSNLSGELVSSSALPTGHSTIVVEVTPAPARPQNTPPARGGAPFPGSGTLSLNGKREATTNFINIPANGGYWSASESLDVGRDLGSPVSEHYKAPFRFTGTIDTITLEVHRPNQNTSRAHNDEHS